MIEVSTKRETTKRNYGKSNRKNGYGGCTKENRKRAGILILRLNNKPNKYI